MLVDRSQEGASEYTITLPSFRRTIIWGERPSFPPGPRCPGGKQPNMLEENPLPSAWDFVICVPEHRSLLSAGATLGAQAQGDLATTTSPYRLKSWTPGWLCRHRQGRPRQVAGGLSIPLGILQA